MRVDISSKGILTIRAGDGVETFAFRSWIENNSIPEGMDICFEDLDCNPIKPGGKAEAKKEAGRVTAKPKTLYGVIENFRKGILEMTGRGIRSIRVSEDLLYVLSAERPYGCSTGPTGEIQYVSLAGIRFEPVQQEPKTEADDE